MHSLLNTILLSNLINAQADTDYYSVSNTDGKQYYNVSNSKCKSRGSYLASVTSTKYNDVLIEECVESGTNNCWIGLVMRNDHFSWIDGTEIDIKFINKSVCNIIESIDNNSEYFLHINIENK